MVKWFTRSLALGLDQGSSPRLESLEKAVMSNLR